MPTRESSSGRVKRTLKTCCRCKVSRQRSEFHRNVTAKDGLQTMCMACKRLDTRNRRRANLQQSRAACKKYYKKHRTKELERAARYRAASPDKVRAACKAWRQRHREKMREPKRRAYHRDVERARQQKRRDYAKHTRKRLEAAREYRRRNRERVREWGRRYALEHPDGPRRAKAKWKRQNPDAVAADRACRRAAEMRAMPPWQRRKDFIPIHALARRMSKSSSIPHVVDHIVPLRHKAVCGLHVPWNVRVIPASDNLRKSNRFSSDE
jgi:hypothetical protein